MSVKRVTASLVSDSGNLEGISDDLILHIGIDTVKLQGKGFHALVGNDTTVKRETCCWRQI